MRAPVFLLSMAALLGPFAGGTVLAAGSGLPAGAAPPFGTVRAQAQAGVRPESLRRPSDTQCPPRSSAGSGITSTRRDPSGRIHVYGETAPLNNRNGNIYNCTGVPGSGKIRANAGAGRPKSAYNARTNTLNAATDGYVNRSATSSMMPRKSPSMYDPATGVIKPSRKLNAYEIYQR
ncbi:hypothetical protein [Zoogloea sp.]|uniref:hypothetical protein n=1 Tax=Zoogloea sp. TaxID=49181 RepID=UPI001AC475DD|nr:hypothetical protein [Zoogloea sp.]MBN8281853.1 hypothetical protein [Zoogloea sp.]